jgi:hypothetical protein
VGWEPVDGAGRCLGTTGGRRWCRVTAPLTGVGTTGNELGLAIDATTLSVNASNELTVNNTAAIWNANQLCGTNLDCSTLSGLGPSDAGEGADVEWEPVDGAGGDWGQLGERRWCR